MSMERNQHDEAVDKVLATLRDVVPPEGMDARIAQRLQQHSAATPGVSSRWFHFFTSSTLAAAWWRGAGAGAAAAMLGFGLLFLAGHLPHGQANRTQAVSRDSVTTYPAPAAALVSSSTADTHSSETRETPCAGPAVLRVHTAPLPRPGQRLLAEVRNDTTAPSHPAPALPLTAEERALVQLAHTPDPKVLAAPDPETQAKLEAQEEAEFQRFFSPPPTPPTKASNE